MKKLIEKLSVLLLCLLILCSCERKPEIRDETVKDADAYVDMLRNYQVRAKNPENTVDDPDFAAFLDEVFVNLIQESYMDVHYTIIDYKKLNIPKNLTLGEIEYGFDEEGFNYQLEIQKRLQDFDYDSLSYRQQIDYDVLEYNCLETIPSYFYYKFNFFFDMANNIAEDLISLFTDYTFYDEESVADYLACLQDIDRYYDDILQYTARQAEDGYPMPDEWIDYTQDDVCASILNRTETNDLIISFDDRIDQLDNLSDEQKQNYKAQNRQIVLDEVLPAYQKISDELEQYRGRKSSSEYKLYKLDKNYADYCYMIKASSNIPVADMIQQTQDMLDMMEAGYLSCVYDAKANALFEEARSGNYELFNQSNAELLEYLRTHLNVYFPEPGDIEYTVDYLDPDNAPNTAIAYYWPSPVDDLNQNIIRVNPNSDSVPFEVYCTMAHEGFPGHLYQNNVFGKTDPAYLRSLVSFIGYSEGWAVYSERLALGIAGIEDENAQMALYYEAVAYFPEYSIVDMMSNNLGMSDKQIYDAYFKDSIFNYNTSYIGRLSEYLTDMPCVYASYGVGAAQFFALRDKAMKALNDKFDYVSFNQALLEYGPLPFPILESLVDAYISSNQ